MDISPSRFTEFPAYSLLEAAAHGRVGFDHRLLHALIDDPDKTLPDLLRFAMEDRTHDPINLENELIAIFRHLRTPDAVPFYIEVLRRNPMDVPEELLDALFPVRQAALEPLLKLYGELEEDESGEVAFLLAAFRIADERVLRILLDRLEYDAGDGALSLGLYGDPAARPALEKVLAELDEADTHLRQDLRDAIDQLGREVDESVPAYDIWEDFPETSLPEFDVLTEPERLEFLTSSESAYRIAAADSFRNQDLSEPALEALFQRAKTDEDAAVRGASWRVLLPEAERPEIHEAMLARLQDESAPMVERAGALIGLANEADKPPVRAYAEKFYENRETRAAALGAMWRSLDRSFGPRFAEHLTDEDPEIKEEAILGVGYLGVHDAAEKLRDFFEDDEFRSDALFAYALSVRQEISKGRVRGLLRKIEEAAGGFAESEEDLVKIALDERLLLNGHEPVFFPERHEHRHAPEGEDAPETPAVPAAAPAGAGKVGRNDPCPCGSGKKYKKCCGA